MTPAEDARSKWYRAYEKYDGSMGRGSAIFFLLQFLQPILLFIWLATPPGLALFGRMISGHASWIDVPAWVLLAFGIAGFTAWLHHLLKRWLIITPAAKELGVNPEGLSDGKYQSDERLVELLQNPEGLMRAADAVPTYTLLRPAGESGEVEPTTLLRPIVK